MQNWKDLYLELCEMAKSKVEEIKWQDLWHNQINFLAEEHPFPAPAIFFSFRTLGTSDMGEKVQNVSLQVDMYLFYETFADTYHESWNQSSALAFLDILSKVYATFHGTSGNNYSNMRRTGFSPIDTGGAGNTYLQTFECTLIDYAALKIYADSTVEDVDVQKGNKPAPTVDEYPFVIL